MSDAIAAEEMLLGQYIPLHYHYNMLLDRTRMDPFREAIALTVPVGGKVLELGGGTGVLSYFAAQQAAKVWCVERNPALARAARSFLADNRHGDRVEVIQADAMSYLPPEPVDVVICEMLHVALVREKQVDVLRSFKENYVQAFGPRLPAFIPDATLLGVQLVDQCFHFGGYHAAVPLFRPPGAQPESRYVSDPEIYSTIYYDKEIPRDFRFQRNLTVRHAGTLNAVSFLTRNFLAFQLDEQTAVDWMMNQLVLPIERPVEVQAGERISVEFAYRAGCPLEALQESLCVERATATISRRNAA